jgi:hypothetical protein
MHKDLRCQTGVKTRIGDKRFSGALSMTLQEHLGGVRGPRRVHQEQRDGNIRQFLDRWIASDAGTAISKWRGRRER